MTGSDRWEDASPPPQANVVIFRAATAGAGIADQFRVVMSLEKMIIVRRCVTNCVTITAYGSGLPWILRDASAGHTAVVR